MTEWLKWTELNGVVVFPTFFNKEFMNWATVISQSCFWWLYRASPSLAAKNIINLISALTIWWCPCVESSLLLLEKFAMTSAFSWQNSISLCPASFHTPRPNLPVTPGISWLPTFAFQSPIMERTSFLCVSSRRSYRSSYICLTSTSCLWVSRSLWWSCGLVESCCRVGGTEDKSGHMRLFEGGCIISITSTIVWSQFK